MRSSAARSVVYIILNNGWEFDFHFHSVIMMYSSSKAVDCHQLLQLILMCGDFMGAGECPEDLYQAKSEKHFRNDFVFATQGSHRLDGSWDCFQWKQTK